MKALLLGYYGHQNLGDELMLIAIREWLAHQGIHVTVLSERPDRVQAAHGVPAVLNVPLLPLWNWPAAFLKGDVWRLILAVARHDALIVGGGDLLRDDHGWKTFFFTIEKAMLALALGKRLYFVNLGVSCLRTRYARALMRLCMKRARLVILRDRCSFDLCASLGATPMLLPDIVAALPTGRPAKAQTRSRPYIVVSLRTDSDAYGMFEWTASRASSLAAALDCFVERRGGDVLFMPFRADSESDDNCIHDQIRSLMRNRNRSEVLPWTLEPQVNLDRIAHAACVLAMRLHAGVLAASFRRPCVLLAYDHKVREFARIAGYCAAGPESLDGDVGMFPVIESALATPPSDEYDPVRVSAAWGKVTLRR